MIEPSNPRGGGTTRRTFLKQSSAAALVGGTVVGLTAPARALGQQADRTLRVALVGCGGRGTGAAANALATAGDVRLVAMADAFADRIESSLGELTSRYPEAVDVPEERRFTGFDAFRRAIDDDVDVVILATPPGFRPQHFAYAVERDRHVFMEKPVAVDAPGVRQVLAAAEASESRGLKVGVGLQRHHEASYLETVQRIHEGALGDLILLRCYWNSSGVWMMPREPDQTEMEYQMRNWYYFNWLCGDHIVEQHIHNLDVCNWLMGGHPVEAQGQGGRQVRTAPEFGEIYDHHMIEFTYADGTRMLSQCRHIRDTWYSVSEHAHGTLGAADVSGSTLRLRDGSEWSFSGENPNPYQVEHDVLFAAIREDRPHNEARNGAIATMTSIMGRMATYSGRLLTWDEALASELSLAPQRYAFDADPPTLPDADGRYAIPTPGVTQAL
jgi:predicted dehydrogenase